MHGLEKSLGGRLVSVEESEPHGKQSEDTQGWVTQPPDSLQVEGVMVEEWKLPSISSDTVAGEAGSDLRKDLDSGRLRSG